MTAYSCFFFLSCDFFPLSQRQLKSLCVHAHLQILYLTKVGLNEQGLSPPLIHLVHFLLNLSDIKHRKVLHRTVINAHNLRIRVQKGQNKCN